MPLRRRQHRPRVGDALLVLEPLEVAEHEQPVRTSGPPIAPPYWFCFSSGLAVAKKFFACRLSSRLNSHALAVPAIGAGFGDDVDDRAGVAAVLGVVGVREDLEFLDRVRRRAQHEAGVERVVVGRAVEQEVVRLVALAVDVEAAGDVAEAAGRGVAVLPAEPDRRRDDTRNQRAELREVAAVERQVDDLLLIDDDAERRVGGFDERRLAEHRHLLFELADLQLHVGADRFVDDDRDRVADGGAESGERRLHLIDAGVDERDRIETVGAGDRRCESDRCRGW